MFFFFFTIVNSTHRFTNPQIYMCSSQQEAELLFYHQNQGRTDIYVQEQTDCKEISNFFIYIHTHACIQANKTRSQNRLDIFKKRSHSRVLPTSKKLLKGIPPQSGGWKRARGCYMQRGSGKELQRKASTKTPLLPRTIWTPTENSALGQLLN